MTIQRTMQRRSTRIGRLDSPIQRPRPEAIWEKRTMDSRLIRTLALLTCWLVKEAVDAEQDHRLRDRLCLTRRQIKDVRRDQARGKALRRTSLFHLTSVS